MDRIQKLLLLHTQRKIDIPSLTKYVHLIPDRYLWYDRLWQSKKKITIDPSKISGTVQLVNYPLLINVTDSDLTTARADGFDIVFVDSNGVKLDHEIQEFDNSTGKLVAWVRIPSLSKSDNKIFMFWNYSSATDQSNKNAVWNAYDAVYHLNNTTFSAGDVKDSTSNSEDATPIGTVSSVTGDIGKALDMDKTGETDSYVDLPTLTNLGSNDFTIIWAGKIHSHESLGATLFSQGNNIFTVNQISKLFFQKQGGGFETITSGISVVLNTFSVVAITRKGLTSGDTKLFINGAQSDNATAIPGIDTGGNVKRICAEDPLQSTRRFDGVADEFRIIVGTALTDNEIKTIQENILNPSTFMTFEAKESLP